MPLGFLSKAALKVVKGGKKSTLKGREISKGTEVRLKEGLDIDVEHAKAVDNINIVNDLIREGKRKEAKETWLDLWSEPNHPKAITEEQLELSDAQAIQLGIDPETFEDTKDLIKASGLKVIKNNED